MDSYQTKNIKTIIISLYYRDILPMNWDVCQLYSQQNDRLHSNSSYILPYIYANLRQMSPLYAYLHEHMDKLNPC